MDPIVTPQGLLLPSLTILILSTTAYYPLPMLMWKVCFFSESIFSCLVIIIITIIIVVVVVVFVFG